MDTIENTNNELIENITNYYSGQYRDLKEEILISIDEGVKEGIKEGTQKGIIDGISECFNIGFLNIKKQRIKDLDEILKEVSADTIEDQVKKTVNEEMCPVIGEKIQDLCDSTLNRIKENDITISENELYAIKTIDITEILNKKIKKINKEIKAHFPPNFVFTAFINGLENGISKCVTKKINNCSEKIEETLQKKNYNKKYGGM